MTETRSDKMKRNARNRERAILESGGRRINLWIDKVAVAALSSIMEKNKLKATAAIELALIETARRHRRHVSPEEQAASPEASHSTP